MPLWWSLGKNSQSKGSLEVSLVGRQACSFFSSNWYRNRIWSIFLLFTLWWLKVLLLRDTVTAHPPVSLYPLCVSSVLLCFNCFSVTYIWLPNQFLNYVFDVSPELFPSFVFSLLLKLPVNRIDKWGEVWSKSFRVFPEFQLKKNVLKVWSQTEATEQNGVEIKGFLQQQRVMNQKNQRHCLSILFRLSEQLNSWMQESHSERESFTQCKKWWFNPDLIWFWETHKRKQKRREWKQHKWLTLLDSRVYIKIFVTDISIMQSRFGQASFTRQRLWRNPHVRCHNWIKIRREGESCWHLCPLTRNVPTISLDWTCWYDDDHVSTPSNWPHFVLTSQAVSLQVCNKRELQMNGQRVRQEGYSFLFPNIQSTDSVASGFKDTDIPVDLTSKFLWLFVVSVILIMCVVLSNRFRVDFKYEE